MKDFIMLVLDIGSEIIMSEVYTSTEYKLRQLELVLDIGSEIIMSEVYTSTEYKLRQLEKEV